MKPFFGDICRENVSLHHPQKSQCDFTVVSVYCSFCLFFSLSFYSILFFQFGEVTAFGSVTAVSRMEVKVLSEAQDAGFGSVCLVKVGEHHNQGSVFGFGFVERDDSGVVSESSFTVKYLCLANGRKLHKSCQTFEEGKRWSLLRNDKLFGWFNFIEKDRIAEYFGKMTPATRGKYIKMLEDQDQQTVSRSSTPPFMDDVFFTFDGGSQDCDFGEM